MLWPHVISKQDVQFRKLTLTFSILGWDQKCSTTICGLCVCGWPVSVHEAHTLGAHVAVGGQDASGRVDPLAARRAESIHAGHALLGPNHILLWIFIPLTHRLKQWAFYPTQDSQHKLVKQSHKWANSRDVNLSSSCGTDRQAFCAGDASPGAPASRGRPVPLRGCAPEGKKHRHRVSLFEQRISMIWWTFKAKSDLFLHQILQVCDPLRVLWVAADVILVKESLFVREATDEDLWFHKFCEKKSTNKIPFCRLPPDIWRCLRSQQRRWPRLGTCWAGWCCRDAACVGTGWSESAAPGSYSLPRRWRSPEGSPPPGN